MKVLFIATVVILYVGVVSAAPQGSGDSGEAPTASGDSGEAPTASGDSGEQPTAPGNAPTASGDAPTASGDAPVQFSWDVLNNQLQPTLPGCKNPYVPPRHPSTLPPEMADTCFKFRTKFNATKILRECGGEGCTMLLPVSQILFWEIS